MICSKKDLKDFLESDKKALNRKTKFPKVNDYIWKYEILLRKCEYYNNCKKDLFSKLMLTYYKYKKFKLWIKCNYSIPINVFDKGLSIVHIGPIIINPRVKIGKNCRIHVGVNIGADAMHSDACPTIGDNVYIGPGAKIFGNIVIADNIAIGANAIVNKSFEEKNISIAGIPAKIISQKGSSAIFKNVMK